MQASKHRSVTQKHFIEYIFALLALVLATAVQAQAWPARNASIVVPYPPGSGPDVLARALADRLVTTTGKPVIVENRAGANAIIGSETVAKASPDGHTLLLVDRLTLAVNPLLYAKLPYSPQQLTGISTIASVNLLWVVRADAPYKTWDEMAAFARKGDAAIAVGTGGPGSVHHLSLELVKRHLGASMTHVPYRGVSPAVTGLLAGDIQAVITGPETVLEHIRAGKLRALVIGADQRLPLLPDVPTLKEVGAPGDLLISTYFTLHAPSNTPKSTIDAIHTTVAPILGEADFVHRFAGRGLVVGASQPSNVEAGISADSARLTKVIRDAGIRLD
ncbi:MAG: tripartite tricarboxylate transporter substrate binding protein [Burkholderiaceae bacterium]|nr:tripartite tricarboxylate transporter substrate binding protein [Burkholderiaceae bacterium]